MISLTSSSDAIVVPDWPAPAGIRAAVTTRRLPGNSLPPYDSFNLGLRSGEDPDTVQANRKLLERAFALPAPPRWLRQVHGIGVARFSGDTSGAKDRSPAQAPNASTAVADAASTEPPTEVEADAAVTSASGVVLAILTADCLPLLLCAEDGSEIGAVHAGWRGLSAGVIERCVAQFRAPPHQLMAWLGPAIGPASYEVGDEVRDAFISGSDAATAAFAPSRAGHWFCDLYTLAHLRLRSAGVERVYGGRFDTLTDERFYSYRRDGARSGRFASLIWSEPRH